MTTKSARRHTKLGWKLDRSKISKQKHEMQYIRNIARKLSKANWLSAGWKGKNGIDIELSTKEIKRLAKAYLKITKNAKK